MGFDERVAAARAADGARRARAEEVAASDDAATVAARAAAAVLLPEVLEAAEALGRLSPPPAPGHLDPEARSRLVPKQHRNGPIVLDARLPDSRSVRARYEFRRARGRRARWESSFVGWSFDLGGGLGSSMSAETDRARGSVTLQVLGPMDAGAGGRFSPDALVERGRVSWSAGSGKETSWSGGSIDAERVLRLILDAAAALIARGA